MLSIERSHLARTETVARSPACPPYGLFTFVVLFPQTVTYSNSLSPHHYAGTAGHRTSPNTSTSSPQVTQAPSPQGQTLDLSVNRYDGVVC